MLLPELDFYVPFIMRLEQGKGAVMEVLTPFYRSPTNDAHGAGGADLAAYTGPNLTEKLFENNLLL